MSNTAAKRKLRSSHATTIISIALVLFLLGTIGFLLLNANRLSVYVKENLGFTVIIKDNAREAEVVRLQKILAAAPYSRVVEYVDKDRAAELLKEELGEDFVEFLGYNPLLASIEVKLNAGWANPDSMTIIEARLMELPEVQEVFYQKDLLGAINENVREIALVLGGFSILLMLISIALINNTIRLSVYSRRFLIKTMQLVGATRGFIRKPFIATSILHGLAGASIAILLLSGLVHVVSYELDGVIGFSDTTHMAILFIFVTLQGVIITVLSTFFAVNKYLRLHSDQLYY